MMRIYQPFSYETTIALNERNKHHMINVMRCRVGDLCQVFDGAGKEVNTKIAQITKKEVILEILEPRENNTESPLKIHLFQALCKGEKMDFIMQKSVELGVTEITPLMTERCDVKLSSDRLEKKMEHWKNIIISATEQSGRAVLPLLHPVIMFHESVQQNTNSFSLLLTPSANKTISVVGADLVLAQSTIAIFIGPEGGFSENEITLAEKQNIHVVNLGKRILRTETASLAVIASLQALRGDF